MEMRASPGEVLARQGEAASDEPRRDGALPGMPVTGKSADRQTATAARSADHRGSGQPPDDDPIAVRRLPDTGTYQATFGFELEAARPASGDATRSEFEGIVASMLSHLREDQEVRVVHDGRKAADGRLLYRLRIHGAAAGGTEEDARASASEVRSMLTIAMGVLRAEFGFVECLATNEFGPLPAGRHRARVRPAGVSICLGSRRGVGYQAPEIAPNADRLLVTISDPGVVRARPGESLPRLLCTGPSPITISLRYRAMRLDHMSTETLARAREEVRSYRRGSIRQELVGGLTHAVTDELIDRLESHLGAWADLPVGYSVDCTVVSDAPLPVALLDVVGEQVFSTPVVPIDTSPLHPVAGAAEDDDQPNALDLRTAFGRADPRPLPMLFPDPRCLDQLAFRRHYANPEVELPLTGVRLGTARFEGGPRPVFLRPDDGVRHRHILGAPGAGKTTLMLNLLRQDMLAGHGCCFIDPHGDAYKEAIRLVPRSRRDDVVLADLTDVENVVGINLLEFAGPDEWAQRYFVKNELGEMIRRIYPNVPEAFGPIFDQYWDNSIELVMDDPDGGGTLADLPRVFEDRAYRAYLLQHCTDPMVRSFWKDMAERAAGEASLANVAPYIASKTAKILGDRRVRRTVGQRRSTIDFSRVMDGGILLINLSRGIIGRNSRFLNMLLLGKLFVTALGRARIPAAQRRKFSVFLDEAQTFVADAETMASMLAEGRKYSLALTLGHQGMNQLSEPLRSAISANVATRIFFRCGLQDASEALPAIQPAFEVQDLTRLPDHHAIVKAVVGGRDVDPFVVRTDGLTESNGPERLNDEEADAMEVEAKRRSTRPGDEVEAEILARRTAYRSGRARGEESGAKNELEL